MNANSFARQTNHAFKNQRIELICPECHHIAAFWRMPPIGNAIDEVNLAVVKIRLHALAADANADEYDLEHHNDERCPNDRTDECVQRVPADNNADVPWVTRLFFRRVHAPTLAF